MLLSIHKMYTILDVYAHFIPKTQISQYMNIFFVCFISLDAADPSHTCNLGRMEIFFYRFDEI